MEQLRRVHHQNRIIYTTLACFLSGLLAQACVGMGFGINLDRIMIGDIMLFIPGLTIVNGVREFFYADILTGVYRLIEALLMAGGHCGGLRGGFDDGRELGMRERDTSAVRRTGDPGLRAVLPCAAPALAAGHPGGRPVLVLYLLVFWRSGEVFLSSLAAATAICLWSETLARVRKAPANIFLIPGIIPLLPGGALYYTMNALISGDVATVIQKGQETGLVALGIVGGILIASELMRVILWGMAHRKKEIQRRWKQSGGQ